MNTTDTFAKLPSPRELSRLQQRCERMAAHRVKVDLMYLHGDPLEKIAKRLGVSVSTVLRDLAAQSAAWQWHLRDDATELRAIAAR